MADRFWRRGLPSAGARLVVKAAARLPYLSISSLAAHSVAAALASLGALDAQVAVRRVTKSGEWV